MAGKTNWEHELPHLERVWTLRSEQHTQAAKDARKQAKGLKESSPRKHAALTDEADQHERDAAAYKRRAATAKEGFFPMHQDDERDPKFKREYSQLAAAAVSDGRAKMEGFSGGSEEAAGAEN